VKQKDSLPEPTWRSTFDIKARRSILVIALLMGLALPATALSWSSYYVQSQSFGPGGIGLSAFNSGLNYNEVSWVGGTMRLTLCDASYQCYDYSPWHDFNSDGEYHADIRTISYGRGKCNSYSGSYVNHCYISN
jgi:hypothetical protein